MITIYPQYRRGKEKSDFFKVFEKMTGLDTLPFSCARSALVSGLRALNLGRMDEILVPPFLGHCVLSALSKTAFPTMTPSARTKAILVLHQFGFQQDLRAIERIAQEKSWKIVNDCCYTVFNRSEGQYLLSWGDFSVFSLAKLYPSLLGGGLYCSQQDIKKKVLMDIKCSSAKDQSSVDKAFRLLRGYVQKSDEKESELGLAALYGYLPYLKNFPNQALFCLPNDIKKINNDISRRKNIWKIIKDTFVDRVPLIKQQELVPFAVPVRGQPDQLEKLSRAIRSKLQVEVPVLHFDFAMNMLKPDYQKALIIGCHNQWTDEIVGDVCEILKKGLR